MVLRFDHPDSSGGGGGGEAVTLGAAGGRKAKRARLLAERQSPDATTADPEIAVLLRDRAALVANLAAAAAALAILVLMAWQP